MPLQQALTDHTNQVFLEKFGGADDWWVSIAPGRVNLIGEHTDYNDGFVLPMAIERHVAVAFRTRPDRIVRLHTEHFDEDIAFDLDDLDRGAVSGWGAYPAGMCWALQQRGADLVGMDAVICANIPIGAGVSSSAALEVSFGLAISAAAALDLSPREIAEVSHIADNEFVGIPSGIMDQFASALCERDHALLIDCRTRETDSIPIPTSALFIVMDTGRRRGLVDSEYADRVAACRRVARTAAEVLPGVTALRDVSLADLRRLKHVVNEIDYLRAIHVIEENDRTLAACQQLRLGDVAGFGRSMIQSHESLRDLYQVSCRELDLTVEIALRQEGCHGARMTGGGFGGAALALVDRTAADAFVESAAQEYAAETEYEGSFFPVTPAGGVRLLHFPRR